LAPEAFNMVSLNGLKAGMRRRNIDHRILQQAGQIYRWPMHRTIFSSLMTRGLKFDINLSIA